MNEVYFRDFAQHILAAIAEARLSIQVAVCWFSHKGIFEALLAKLRAGIRVQLILEYDSRNIHPEGLPFQRFVLLGGALFAHRDANLMHHKFAIIDERMLLTGSFNWTNSSNAENLVRTTDPGLVAAFQDAFFKLKAVSVPVYAIRPKDLKFYSDSGLFEDQGIDPGRIRLKLSLGAKVWRLAPDYGGLQWVGGQPASAVYFDSERTLRSYWRSCIWHDQALLKRFFHERGEKSIPPDILLWMVRLRKGDLVLVSKSGWDYLGLVETDPLPSDRPVFAGRYGLRWLRVIGTGDPVCAPKYTRKNVLQKIRGSRFGLVDRFY